VKKEIDRKEQKEKGKEDEDTRGGHEEKEWGTERCEGMEVEAIKGRLIEGRKKERGKVGQGEGEDGRSYL